MDSKEQFDKPYGYSYEKALKAKKVKLQCNGCGWISDTECVCKKCNQGTMHKYRNVLGR